MRLAVEKKQGFNYKVMCDEKERGVVIVCGGGPSASKLDSKIMELAKEHNISIVVVGAGNLPPAEARLAPNLSFTDKRKPISIFEKPKSKYHK